MYSLGHFHASMLLQVLEEGSWSDAVDSALSKLNCKILDSKLLVPRRHEKVVNFHRTWSKKLDCFWHAASMSQHTGLARLLLHLGAVSHRRDLGF